MVWNTSQSPLYKAVETHNAEMRFEENRRPDAAPDIDKSCTNATPDTGKSCTNTGTDTGESCAAPCTKSAAFPAGKQFRPAPRQNELNGLLQDKDSLLLIALIFVLVQNKADIRLIAALAFVLLG